MTLKKQTNCFEPWVQFDHADVREKTGNDNRPLYVQTGYTIFVDTY